MRREVHDALDFFFLELLVRLQHQHDGRRGRLLILLVEAVFRQHDVDAGFLHGINLLDRARELALQCLQVVDLVLELRDAELAVVKNLEALLAARQSFRREAQARLMHLVRRHEDGRALLVLLDFVIDLVFLELRCNLASILRLHVREQRHHVRLAAVPCADAHDGDEDGEHDSKENILLFFAVFVPKLQIAFLPLRLWRFLLCVFCFVFRHVLNPFAHLVACGRPSSGKSRHTCMRMIS